jgi:hypothetical protein
VLFVVDVLHFSNYLFYLTWILQLFQFPNAIFEVFTAVKVQVGGQISYRDITRHRNPEDIDLNIGFL